MKDFAEGRFEKGKFADPDRILVATDLQDSDYILPHAAAQAKASHAAVTLVHAVSPANAFPVEPVTGSVLLNDQGAGYREARLELRGLANQLKSQGISCETVVRHGFPVDVILEEVGRSGASRLIAGTHGRGHIGQMLLGSVADELLRRVEIPLFTVGPRARDFSKHDIPRRILHPVSLAGDFRGSVECAIDLAQTYRAELTLLHVLSPDTVRGVRPETELTQAMDALVGLLHETMDMLHPIKTMVKCGKVVEEILKAAAVTHADWIVMGVDGRYPLRPFRESKAYKVLSLAECPVLTVRHEPNRAAAERAREERFMPVIG